MVDLEYENKAREQGYKNICGIDEAGRGPLAGPVCAAAVILPKDKIIEGINDSKKISEKRREKIFEDILKEAVSVGIGWASVEEIEEINILNAAMLAMKRAVDNMKVKPDFVYIDGNTTPPLGIDCEAVTGGDAKIMSVAAASIVAKVSRDRLMREYAEEYPDYGFEKHKGYGTKAHTAAILEYGACPLHRPSFLKKLYAKNGKKDEQRTT